MADLPTNASFFVWVSKDSQRILGFDHRSPEEAYKSAQDRHTDTRGFPAQVAILGFPQGSNPMIAVVKAFHETFPPTRVEGGTEPEADEAEKTEKKLKKVK